MSLEIYKLCYLTDNKIEKIYVYNGYSENPTDSDSPADITELYKTDKTIFDNIFNEEEIANIVTNNIPVYFLDSYIYLDDTIRTIKKKIFKYVRDIALETIYLFCAYKQQLNTLSIYDNLTQGGKLELNKLRLSQFFLNINRPDYIDKLETKSVYTYDDLLNFDLDNKLGKNFLF